MKKKIILTLGLVIFTLFIGISSLTAQINPPPPPEGTGDGDPTPIGGGAPLGGGAFLLAGFVLAYAGKKAYASYKKEEEDLSNKAAKAETQIEERLLFAYHRLRGNAKNGLAVVTIQRDSCSGCFNQIPPQRQSDIRQHKKIIVCEHCGRILVDEAIAGIKEEA